MEGKLRFLKWKKKQSREFVLSKIIRLFLCVIFFSSASIAQQNSKNLGSQPDIQVSHLETDRISLNFQDIKVRTVLQLLAEFTGIDMVISDTVSGNISLHLNEVPWEQALSIILTTRSLASRTVGKTILIAPRQEIIDGEKKEYNVQQDLVNLAPLRSAFMQINYAKASDIATLLRDKNAAILSSRGRLSVDERTNTLWVEDNVGQINQIKRLIKHFDVPVQQVLIEARIVNVAKDFARDLGIRFGVSRPAHLRDSLRGNRPLEAKGEDKDAGRLDDRLNFDLVTTPLSSAPASIGIALAKLGDGILLDLELSALESEGRGEIISSPRLITTNQQAAVIESGEEIPYQEKTFGGATAVAFKKAVLSLKVTPEITPDGTILMDLHINQDIPSVRLFNEVPSILTKELKTRVSVKNGQTLVLGGIYKQDKYKTVNRVPFLGELPGVGAFFRNQSTTIRNEELLIFITPRIIANNLSINTKKGQRQAFSGGLELDKFGKPVGSIH